MKLIRITQYTLALAFIFQSLSCSDDYLEETTYGEVAPAEMTNPENVERAIISAYSVLNGQFDTASNAFNSPSGVSFIK